jgi:hypothetical protein
MEFFRTNVIQREEMKKNKMNNFPFAFFLNKQVGSKHPQAVRGQPKHIYGAACCLLPQPASW